MVGEELGLPACIETKQELPYEKHENIYIYIYIYIYLKKNKCANQNDEEASMISHIKDCCLQPCSCRVHCHVDWGSWYSCVTIEQSDGHIAFRKKPDPHRLTIGHVARKPTTLKAQLVLIHSNNIRILQECLERFVDITQIVRHKQLD